MGEMATSPLPSRGSPPHHSIKIRSGPLVGRNGYTPAVSGIPTASERGDKIRSGPLVGKMATSPLPSRGSPPHHSGGTKSEVAHLWAKWLPHPCRLGDPRRIRAGGQIQKWIPTLWAPLPSRGSPPHQRGGTKSEVAHLWAKWLPHPCRLGDPHRCRLGDSGGTKSEVAHLWAKWLPHPCRLGDPHCLRAGGQNQKWPTCGRNGYFTPAVSGIPTASERGDKIRSGPLVGKMATSPLPSRGSLTARGSPPHQSGGTKSEVAHLWAKWLPHPCRLGDPHRIIAGGQNQLVGEMATSPLPSRGSPPHQNGGTKSEVAHLWAKWLPHPCRLGDPHRIRAGGQNQKWPTCGRNGYLTPAVSGIPTASERGDKIRSGPLVGEMATSDCRLRDPHRIRAGGQNQKWPTCGRNGYLTLAVSGIPTASERGNKIRSGPLVCKRATSPLPSRGSPPHHSGGTKSEVAHLRAKWLPHPCRLGDPHRIKAGGQNQKWPTCGQNGYLTPAVSGIRTAS